jgi:hypothetical protein
MRKDTLARIRIFNLCPFKITTNKKGVNMSLLNTKKVSALVILLCAYLATAEIIGNQNVGSSSSSTAKRSGQKFEVTENGTINSVTIYHAGTGTQLIVAVYADNAGAPGALISRSSIHTANTTAGWQTVSLDGGAPISQGDYVWLAWFFETAPGTRYVSGSGCRYVNVTWPSGATPEVLMPSSFGSSSSLSRLYSVYATYTPDAGGGTGGWTSASNVTWTDDQVGIGTSTIPGGSTTMLAVNGTIRAREVIVTTQGWPDHVLKPDYNLKPLHEVEKYIKKNSRLEGIPSEKEVMTTGVPMGEMQAKLLQKLEETTLYLIEMKKENEALKARLAAIEQKVR